jgi:hypothetical protein
MTGDKINGDEMTQYEMTRGQNARGAKRRVTTQVHFRIKLQWIHYTNQKAQTYNSLQNLKNIISFSLG